MLKRALILLALCAATPSYAQQIATGVVYNDANGNGLRDPGEKGIPNVRVSNQRDVTVTGSDGRYVLPVTDDTIVFVVKPRNWSTPVDANMIPRFYYIHKPAGSPKQKHPGVAPTGPLPSSVDFPLRRSKEPNRFKAAFFGDTQTRLRDIPSLAHEFIELLPQGEFAFGMAQGDITSENPPINIKVAETMAASGFPWYYAMGNHDKDFDSPDHTHSCESFQSVFGPEYSSFDYGPVHFVTLEDIKWNGKSYTGGLGEKQLEWLKNDLAFCPRNQLVVLSYHIPIGQLGDKAALFQILEPHPNLVAVCGHTHWMSNHFIGKDAGFNRAEPLHELINGTTCGSWWAGPPDEQGLPVAMMSDGAPNGYTSFTFDGTKYRAEYRVARRALDFQMSIFAPEAVASDALAGTDVFANVFAGSEKSTVEMRVDGAGAWNRLEKVTQPDPFLKAMKAAQPKSIPADWAYPEPLAKCPHLWRGTLPTGLAAGSHLVNVRTTDMYGQKYEARRLIVVQ